MEDEPLIKLGEYIELRKRTNTELLYIIKELKRCIEDYKEYDKKQKEILADCNVRIGIQNARIKNQKKVITDMLKAINKGNASTINEESILSHIDKLYEGNIAEMEKLRKALNKSREELDGCKKAFKQIIGISYEGWMDRVKLRESKKEV